MKNDEYNLYGNHKSKPPKDIQRAKRKAPEQNTKEKQQNTREEIKRRRTQENSKKPPKNN